MNFGRCVPRPAPSSSPSPSFSSSPPSPRHRRSVPHLQFLDEHLKQQGTWASQCAINRLAATDDDEQRDPLATPHPLLGGYRSESRFVLSARYRLAAATTVSYTRNVYRATPTGLANRLTHSGQITPTAPRSAPPAAVAPHTSNRTAKGRAKGATHTCARPRTRVRFRGSPPHPT